VRERLQVGETGYMTANIKSPTEVKMGDTITDTAGIHRPRCRGSRRFIRWYSAGFYPINTGDYEHLKASLGKLQLNDSAFAYQPEDFGGRLGFGFRCGFLGLLHLEIVQERLRRELRHGHHCDLPERHLPGYADRWHRKANR